MVDYVLGEVLRGWRFFLQMPLMLLPLLLRLRRWLRRRGRSLIMQHERLLTQLQQTMSVLLHGRFVLHRLVVLDLAHDHFLVRQRRLIGSRRELGRFSNRDTVGVIDVVMAVLMLLRRVMMTLLRLLDGGGMGFDDDVGGGRRGFRFDDG